MFGKSTNSILCIGSTYTNTEPISLVMKRLLSILILSSIVISGCRQVTLPWTASIDPTNTPRSPSKHITDTTLPLVEHWRWTGIIPGSEHPPLVVVIKDQVIIADYDGQGTYLVTFNAPTGDLIWQSEYINHLESLGAIGNQTYVGTIRYAQAFNLETGKILWQGAKQSLDKKGFLYVYPTPERVHVYDFQQSHLYLLDPQTGVTVEEIDYPNIFFKQGNILYSGCGYGFKTQCLIAADAKNNQILWSQRFGGFVNLWPVFTEDRIVLNAGGQISAIDNITGEIIWQAGGRFIAGPIRQNNLIYAVRSDAEIVAFDFETGEEVGTVSISPNRTTEDDGGYVLHYAIAASDKFVAVYYGNSHELIVFENVEDTEK